MSNQLLKVANIESFVTGKSSFNLLSGERIFIACWYCQFIAASVIQNGASLCISSCTEGRSHWTLAPVGRITTAKLTGALEPRLKIGPRCSVPLPNLMSEVNDSNEFSCWVQGSFLPLVSRVWLLWEGLMARPCSSLTLPVGRQWTQWIFLELIPRRVFSSPTPRNSIEFWYYFSGINFWYYSGIKIVSKICHYCILVSIVDTILILW